MKYYKIAIVGFGSIGRRHLVNISKVLSLKNISFSIDLIRRDKKKNIGYDMSNLIKNVFSSDDNIPNDYDIIFITNPTHLHYQTIKRYVSKTKHMFIEKPVFDDYNLSIDDLMLNENGVYYVACPLRYMRVIQYVKNEIDLSNVFSTRVICSSYLPNWRPDVDYKKAYSAHQDEGGGVSIDLIHEWDYIYYLFGYPEKTFNIKGKFSNLEIDSDDLSIYIAEYRSMLLELHLDYFGKKSIREIQLFTKEDTVTVDLINSEIRYMKSGSIISLDESRDEYQCREITCFLDIIEGLVENHNDIDTAIKTLKIAKGGVLL